MKVLVLDTDAEGMGLDIALRAQDFEHEVKYWLPAKAGGPYGKGLLERPETFEPWMDWADLIILTGNSNYEAKLVEYFGRGYPIFGANPKAAQLELDRGHGMEVLKEYGVKVPNYKVVSSPDEATQYVCDTGSGYALKPWGGAADKATTAVCKGPDHALFIIDKMKKESTWPGQMMMQECIDGIEIGISGFFGPGGWNAAIEESFEHKKFLNDDLGENTGEQGTVIRHITESKLFDQVLDPITDYLHMVNYVGDCAVNCIIDKRGTPWPLEFTMRLGWPDFCIRQAVIQGDPVNWMLDLIRGEDTLRVRQDVACGVVLTHGDYPRSRERTWDGYPIFGLDTVEQKNIHWQQAQAGKAPLLHGENVKQTQMMLTAGTYVCVATGRGPTVKAAQKAAYATAWGITWPSNVMMRTDIGDRLKDDLMELHRLGYCKGLKYG